MTTDRPARRLTLRQLLTTAEKCARDLLEHLQAEMLVRLTDFRDLSRPVRRRSHYPTMVAVQNAMKKVADGAQEVDVLSGHLLEQLQEIRERAQRERVNRM